MTELAPGLAGPVEVALARAQDELPRPDAVPGGYAYELKWDGFRLVVVRTRTRTRLWSRTGTDLTPRFPDIAAAAHANLPAGTVLDGEVVAWNGARLDFDLLCQRLSTSPARMAALAATAPASYVAFDVLALDGDDMRPRPWVQRRTALTDLAAAWRPPLHLTPTTTDPAEARAWALEHQAAGLEGLVVKPCRSPYVPGRRAWIKVKTRATHEAVVGAVIGALSRPHAAILGRVNPRGHLVILARTVALSRPQAADLARFLSPAARGHPWPERIRADRFGPPGELVTLTRVAPLVVVEFSADTARHAVTFRHPVRYLRHRPDLQPHDLTNLDD